MTQTESSPVMVFMTTESQSEAKRLAHILVEKRLVACVNIIPNVISVYRWQGQVTTDQEWILLAKTQSIRLESIKNRLRQNHTYDVPCMTVLPIADGLPEYLTWLMSQTQDVPESSD